METHCVSQHTSMCSLWKRDSLYTAEHAIGTLLNQ